MQKADYRFRLGAHNNRGKRNGEEVLGAKEGGGGKGWWGRGWGRSNDYNSNICHAAFFSRMRQRVPFPFAPRRRRPFPVISITWYEPAPPAGRSGKHIDLVSFLWASSQRQLNVQPTPARLPPTAQRRPRCVRTQTSVTGPSTRAGAREPFCKGGGAR